MLGLWRQIHSVLIVLISLKCGSSETTLLDLVSIEVTATIASAECSSLWRHLSQADVITILVSKSTKVKPEFIIVSYRADTRRQTSPVEYSDEEMSKRNEDNTACQC